MSGMTELVVSKQTVTPDGQSIAPRIAGVQIHHPPTHQDDRGTLCEIYNQAWAFDDIPLVHAYLVTVRPGKVKGWAVHGQQVDRYFFCSGSLKLVLYDGRDDSPTKGMINELYFSELNRGIVLVPPGIFHAVENVGITDGLLFNLPSEPYRYEAPDKKTLPLENDLVPYSFAPRRGG
jgi:dTDP-4-dehydrorhamnose 3,5-epimerase